MSVEKLLAAFLSERRVGGVRSRRRLRDVFLWTLLASPPTQILNCTRNWRAPRACSVSKSQPDERGREPRSPFEITDREGGRVSSQAT